MKNTAQLWVLTLIIFLIPNNFFAQSESDQLLQNIPKDSLTFVVYGNTANMPEEVKEKLHESLPEVCKGITDESEKFCIYSHKHELYDAYTLKFNLDQNKTQLNPDSLLNLFGFTVKDLQLPFIKLDGGNFKKGLFYINNSDFVLRIYTQILPVDEQVKAEYKKLSEDLKFANYDERNILWERIDSLMKKDSIPSAQFFDHLLEKEKSTIASSIKTETLDFQSVFNTDISKSAALLYLNAKKIREIPFHIYNIFKTDIHDINDLTTKIAGFSGYYEDIWVNIKTQEEKLNITTIASLPKKQKLHHNLDKELCLYLPAQETNGICIFNMEPAALKNSLIEYFNYPDYNEKKQLSSKLAIWALDDDVLNSMGNGFITLLDDHIDKRHIPDFKMALKMKNKESGRQLLSILANDAKAISKIKDNCYLVTYEELYEKKKVHLVIDDDIWILGTQSVDELKTRINTDQFNDLYPQLNNKSISQYLYIDPEILSSSRTDLEFIESKTNFIGKNLVKTETSLIIND
ncbi:hypothetical protein [Plebeiibacterium sediminum]|uniref:DUF4836 family protein n=1 Tax=Plebeiibacterium sediminum TaxID=2992112 RepID=A0AAE3M169_9BACT|nr:hypothetical protein [Plebeiobacterium sediminum]MCW3785317.1 hypothetical protein [Plebeiobacterium sediminum]